MITYLRLGEVPEKPHIAFRNTRGELYHEECFTRRGFDGTYSIIYHRYPPMVDSMIEPSLRGWRTGQLSMPAHQRRLFQPCVAKDKEIPLPALDAHEVMLHNEDVEVSVVRPRLDDDVFLANNDGDDLYFILQGSALLETPLGSLTCAPLDYVWIPRSLPYRFVQVDKEAYWLHLEVKKGLHIPRQYVNEHGQLRMDAPYSYRDFKYPQWTASHEDSLTEVVVKRAGQFFLRRSPTPLLDVVGFDGYVYPIAFPILNYQPRVGLVHLPPTIHMTFAAPGFIVCSFVPRLVDFHKHAIPCPYPHSSVDCDEMIFYCRGNFTSRRGVSAGAISLHPAGVPHGPHPGAYAASIGTTHTEELAVMLDTFLPLLPTEAALKTEYAPYHQSWYV